jgi:glycerophosphoryl diester phosphodiesterase
LNILNRQKALISSVAAIALLGLWLVYAVFVYSPTYDLDGFEIAAPASLWQGSEVPQASAGGRQLIAHAAGAIDGHVYTNSMEALEQAVANGFRLIELDFRKTSDGHLVAVHHWAQFRRFIKHEDTADTPLSLAEFKQARIHGRYTPLTAQDVSAFFMAHPELILVTDKSNDFSELLEVFPFHERLIIEVFGFANYKKALEAGVQRPMLSISGRQRYLDFVNKHGVQYVALAVNDAIKRAEVLRDWKQQGISIFAYTSNDEAFVSDAVPDFISAVYTDHLVPGVTGGDE